MKASGFIPRFFRAEMTEDGSLLLRSIHVPVGVVVVNTTKKRSVGKREVEEDTDLSESESRPAGKHLRSLVFQTDGGVTVKE